MAFQYKPRAPEAWEKRASGNLWEGFAKDEFLTYTFKKENNIRILPPTWEKASHYGLDLWLHYSVGPGRATVICSYKMKAQKCPICEAMARAETAGNEAAVKDLKPARRVLIWMLDRSDEKQPLLASLPWTVDRDISKVCRDRGTGELFQIDNPDSGRDVYFDREQKGGSSQNVEYSGFQVSSRSSSVDEKHIEYVVKHPLPDTLLWRSYEEVQALFEGAAPEVESASPASTAVATAPPPTVATAAPPTQIRQAAAPVAVMPPPEPPPVQAAPPPPVQPFVSAWTGTNCSCGEPQYTTPTGVACKNGHTGNSPTPTNGQAVPEADPIKSRTAALKTRFQTGPAK